MDLISSDSNQEKININSDLIKTQTDNELQTFLIKDENMEIKEEQFNDIPIKSISFDDTQDSHAIVQESSTNHNVNKHNKNIAGDGNGQENKVEWAIISSNSNEENRNTKIDQVNTQTDNELHTFPINRRTVDGLHWEPHAMRMISNLLLTHISLAIEEPLPNRFTNRSLDNTKRKSWR